MKLRITFDEIKNAIESSSFERHYFIDKKKHEILFISQCEDNYREKLDHVDNGDFIFIPPRMSQEDAEIMRSFTYDIQDMNLAQRFHEVLDGKKPFKHIKELLDQHPELKNQWFLFKDRTIRNEALNWLCTNNLELEDK